MSASAARTAPSSPGLERIATLVHIERRARMADSLAELGFIMVNETLGLISYRQAALLGRARAGREILMISGVSEPSADAPFSIWLKTVLRHAAAAGDGRVHVMTAADVPPQLAAEWASLLPAVLVVIPLRRDDLDLGVLALARDEKPTDGDARILGMLSEAYAHCWEALAHRRRLRPRQLRPSWRRWLPAALVAAMATLSFLPVPSAVLAPAEVIPIQPAVVRSALDGVLDRLLIQPNQPVAEGQVLALLDARRMQNQLQAARLSAIAAEAELRQARQAAVLDPRVRSQLPMLQGRVDQQLAEVRFLEGQQDRLEIRASRAGIAVFDNAHEWIGRPVTIGERIMQIADPAAIELEIRLPVSDAIDLANGAKVLFFRNVDPHRPTPGRLNFIGYRAVPGADGIVAFRMKAHFDEGIPWKAGGDAGFETAGKIIITDSSSSPVRRGGRFDTPETGQYEIRLRRTTADATNPRLIDNRSSSSDMTRTRCSRQPNCLTNSGGVRAPPKPRGAHLIWRSHAGRLRIQRYQG